MSSVNEILVLHSNGKLLSGFEFKFKVFKNNRKFLIKVVYFSDDNVEINAAYEDNICPKIECRLSELKEEIDGIENHFRSKFRPKTRILGPIIYGHGHGTGFGGCCRDEVYEDSMVFKVSDINKEWSHDNRSISSCYMGY